MILNLSISWKKTDKTLLTNQHVVYKFVTFDAVPLQLQPQLGAYFSHTFTFRSAVLNSCAGPPYVQVS